MKKYFFLLAIPVALFSFVSCGWHFTEEPTKPTEEPAQVDPRAPGAFAITRCELVNGKIEVEWSSAANADYYELWYRLNSGNAFTLGGGQLQTTGYTDGAPLSGTNVYWVVAHNDYGTSRTESKSVY